MPRTTKQGRGISNLSKEERRERARKAATARWVKAGLRQSIAKAKNDEAAKLAALNEAALKPIFTEDIKDHERPVKPIEYVYLIWQSSSSLYKIGVSKAPYKRLRELQSGQGVVLRLVAVMLVKDAYEKEGELHKRYQAFRRNGEWFELPPLVLLDIMHQLNIDLKEVVDRMAEIQAYEAASAKDTPAKEIKHSEFNPGFKHVSAKTLGRTAINILNR